LPDEIQWCAPLLLPTEDEDYQSNPLLSLATQTTGNGSPNKFGKPLRPPRHLEPAATLRHGPPITAAAIPLSPVSAPGAINHPKQPQEEQGKKDQQQPPNSTTTTTDTYPPPHSVFSTSADDLAVNSKVVPTAAQPPTKAKAHRMSLGLQRREKNPTICSPSAASSSSPSLPHRSPSPPPCSSPWPPTAFSPSSSSSSSSVPSGSPRESLVSVVSQPSASLQPRGWGAGVVGLSSPRRQGNHLSREDSISDMLSDPFLQRVLPAFKKLAGSNKQLIVVCRYASRSAESRREQSSKKSSSSSSSSSLSSACSASGALSAEALARVQTLNNQLELVKESFNKVNEDFLERIRDSARDSATQQQVVDLFNMVTQVANSASFLVNCCKAVTIELSERDLFKQVLQATRTIRDALLLTIESFKESPTPPPPPQVTPQLMNETEKKLLAAFTTVKQSTMQLVVAQAAVIGDTFVPFFRKQEILGAVRAAVVASTKLLWLIRDSGEGEEIVSSAKVTAVTVSQLSAALLEAANDDLMLAYADFRQLLVDAVARLKGVFANYIHETKSIFSEKGRSTLASSLSASTTLPVYEEMKEAIRRILAVTDLLSQVSLANIGSCSPVVGEANEAYAQKIIEELSPPPPPSAPSEDHAEKSSNTLLLSYPPPHSALTSSS